MKIKITERSRELYGAACPFSTEKCDSLEELNYKIQRAVELGKMKKKNDGTRIVQYYNNQIHIKNGEIVNIVKTKECYDVSYKLKAAHYNRTFKVVV